MKKIIFLFAGLFLLFVIQGCKDDPIEYPQITGTWKPVKMVETIINNNVKTSETYTYTTCQQESRWKFNEDNSGHVLLKKDLGTPCVVSLDSNMSYTYDQKTGDITINYLTGQDKGKVSDITDTTMNLKVESIDLDLDIYESQTYTMVRVN